MEIQWGPPLRGGHGDQRPSPGSELALPRVLTPGPCRGTPWGGPCGGPRRKSAYHDYEKSPRNPLLGSPMEPPDCDSEWLGSLCIRTTLGSTQEGPRKLLSDQMRFLGSSK